MGLDGLYVHWTGLEERRREEEREGAVWLKVKAAGAAGATVLLLLAHGLTLALPLPQHPLLPPPPL